VSTLVICNPVAGGGRARAAAARPGAEVVFTRAPGHATALAARAVREGRRRIAVAGGDGTVHEVVQGLLGDGAVPDGVRLACLGGGTSGDFARRLAERPAVERADVLRVACHDGAGRRIVRYAVNAVNVGLIAEATAAWRARRGAVALAARVSLDAGLATAALAAIARHRPREVATAIDGGERERLRVSALLIAKNPRLGGSAHLGTAIEPDDGRALLATLAAGTPLGLLGVVPAAFAGALHRHPAVHRRDCRAVVVEPATALIVEADGELIGLTPLRVDVVPRALPVTGAPDQRQRHPHLPLQRLRRRNPGS
jgi:diacylglycerol kinase (ATP)